MLLRLISLFVSILLVSSCSKPQPPTLTPRSAQVSGIFAGGVELTVALSAHNPNSFPLVVNRVAASLELQDGTPLGSATSSEAFSVPAEGDGTINAKLRVQLTSLSALAPYALSAKAVPYRLKGSSRIGGERLNMDVPFSLDGVLTPEQAIAAGLHGAADLLQKQP